VAKKNSRQRRPLPDCLAGGKEKLVATVGGKEKLVAKVAGH